MTEYDNYSLEPDETTAAPVPDAGEEFEPLAESGSTKVCLDLFCGLGGFSAAFADTDDWQVVTVDIQERFDPDLQADIMDLRPADLVELLPGDGREAVDVLVVLASPPCTEFSMAASSYEKIVDGQPQTGDARDAVALVYHALGLVHALAPDYWVLENPKGYLRQFIGEPTATVTYCQYGKDYMKPTDLWGDLPPMRYRRCTFGDACHQSNTDGEHGGLGNLNVTGTRDPAERAKVPYELSEAIREAVDDAVAGEAPEQMELGEAMLATDGGGA
jgi:hypothetical protein